MAAPWRAALEASLAKNAHLPHARYMQLATVRGDGRPACRTVVYRGLLGDTDHVTFVTDARSAKVEEIRRSPWGEVAWYFSETREQYRLQGRLTVVSSAGGDAGLQAARLRAWQRMSDPGRQQFTWPQSGAPRNEASEAAFAAEPPSRDSPAAEAFCLVFMEVEEADHLRLATNQRERYTRAAEGSGGGGGWRVERVNP